MSKVSVRLYNEAQKAVWERALSERTREQFRDYQRRVAFYFEKKRAPLPAIWRMDDDG